MTLTPNELYKFVILSYTDWQIKPKFSRLLERARDTFSLLPSEMFHTERFTTEMMFRMFQSCDTAIRVPPC